MNLWWVVIGLGIVTLVVLAVLIALSGKKKPHGVHVPAPSPITLDAPVNQNSADGTKPVPAANASSPAEAGQAQAPEPATAPIMTAPVEVYTDKKPADHKHADPDAFDRQAEDDVEHIFNDQFREELRNRGRLHFEKIIGENAMFLQQDLRLTTSQLNDFMKQEITNKLKEEFAKYEQSIVDAKEVAIDAIEKTKLAVEENRRQLLNQLEQEFAAEKANEIKRFEENMTDVINHYLVAAIGDQIDLSDQLEYILTNLEANRQAIIQDLINGA
jgi:hypothetical protein